jgi:hypothetical protein
VRRDVAWRNDITGEDAAERRAYGNTFPANDRADRIEDACSCFVGAQEVARRRFGGAWLSHLLDPEVR